jgi:hypothetical protein
MESLVRMLESMVAAAQSAGFRGTMYTAAGASWSMNSLVGFGLLFTRRLLDANGWAMHWRVPSRSSNRFREAPFFDCDTA